MNSGIFQSWTPMHENVNEIIKGCIRGHRQCQGQLYNIYAPAMYVVSQRYARNREEAEEILQEGFLNAFSHMNQFRFEGSFEGWLRKIVVNCALQKYRRNKQLNLVIHIDDAGEMFTDEADALEQISAKELLKMMQKLPPAYRMVFNLYAFEGMKHREIAQHLGISEGTSKSNLSDARAFLKREIHNSRQVAQIK